MLTGRVTFQIYGLAGPFGAAGFGPEITGKVEASSESGFAPTTQMVVALKTELSTGVDSSFCRGLGKKLNAMPQAFCGQIGQLNKSWTPEPYEIFRHPEEVAMAPDYTEYGEQWPDACWGGTTDSEARIELKIGKSRSGSIAAWDASLPKPTFAPGFQDTPICVAN